MEFQSTHLYHADEGTDIEINTTGYTISSADSANIALMQTLHYMFLVIQPITGLTGKNKVYGTNEATATEPHFYQELQERDDVFFRWKPCLYFCIRKHRNRNHNQHNCLCDIRSRCSQIYTETTNTFSKHYSKSLNNYWVDWMIKYNMELLLSASGTADVSGVVDGEKY
jgi:hypothetical protein